MPPDSALRRKQRGPMADWDLTPLLLRRIEHAVLGGNWQRGGGKGKRPKPIELPGGKARTAAKASPDDIAQKLRNLGLIPVQDARAD